MPITSTRRVGELNALGTDPPCTTLHKDKVPLRLHSKFLSQVASDFYLNQSIHLPVFFPKPYAHKEEQNLHILDLRRALAFYLDKTKPFEVSSQLFILYAEYMRGQPSTTQPLSEWLISCIAMCCTAKDVTAPPEMLTAHSTRAHSASAAFVTHVPVVNICRAAT